VTNATRYRVQGGSAAYSIADSRTLDELGAELATRGLIITTRVSSSGESSSVLFTASGIQTIEADSNHQARGTNDDGWRSHR
jgi:hypothetical protein